MIKLLNILGVEKHLEDINARWNQYLNEGFDEDIDAERNSDNTRVVINEITEFKRR